MSDIKNKQLEESHKYVMDRIQKLTAALYRVTDLFSDKEPLKWTLRNNAIDSYTKFMSIRTNPVVFEELIDSVQQIIYILELISTGTFISSTNFEILKKEYVNLKVFLEGKKEIMVPEQKFLIEPIGHISKSKKADIGHQASAESVKKRPLETAYAKIRKGLSSEERKQKILDFLMKDNNKTVKEITAIFRDISEKSIQRDLFDLVKLGKLVTMGEKRWRTYSLIVNF